MNWCVLPYDLAGIALLKTGNTSDTIKFIICCRRYVNNCAWFKVKCDVAESNEEIFAVEVLLLKTKFVIIWKDFKIYLRLKAFDWSVFFKKVQVWSVARHKT